MAKSNLPEVYRKYFVSKEDEMNMLVNPSSDPELMSSTQRAIEKGDYKDLLNRFATVDKKFHQTVKQGFPVVSRKVQASRSGKSANKWLANQKNMRLNHTSADFMSSNNHLESETKTLQLETGGVT